jgi:glycosyltransferase involved in cell wall biosynthesis
MISGRASTDPLANVHDKVAAVASRFDPEELGTVATIGIDVTALATPASGGIGTAQYQAMRALAEIETTHRFVLYAGSPPVVPFTRLPIDLPWPVRLGSGPSTRSNIIWMQTGVNRLLAEDRVDVFWGPRHLLPFRMRGIAKVATVHDFWDRYYPGQQPWLNRTANRVLIAKVVASADVVVTPSVATARDVTRFCRVAFGNVRVVPWGVDLAVYRPLPVERIAAVLARLGVKSPYVLSLDIFNPRKNFTAVLAAVARLPQRSGQAVTVVGVGQPRKTAAASAFREQAVALGLRERLRVLDDLDTEDLIGLYCGASAFIYPSLYEGFGMPVLEAMACGCPVIAGDQSALPEVAGDAALLVDPMNAEELAKAIILVTVDSEERARLVAAGSARVLGFAWRRTAEGMLAAFERALAVRAGGIL